MDFLLTPHSAREGDEHTESLGVVLCALIRLEPLEDADHDRENDNFARRAHCKGHVGYPVPLE